MTQVREAAVAGMFYPGKARELESAVRTYLAGAEAPAGPTPKAIIAPHAGYVYSGPIAASAYARLRPARGRVTRVVLLGPCHRVAVRGLALSDADAFATPLGLVAVDKEAAARILALPQVSVFGATHRQEHSLEVHLPFLQVVLGEFRVLPLVVGDAAPREVAEVLDVLWGGPETLIVVSSDLSHYHDYDIARRIDRETCAAVEALDPGRIGFDQACGRVPMGGLLVVAKRRQMRVATVDLRNSGDTAGTREQVVGYGSWLFYEAEQRPQPAAGGGETDFGPRTRRLLARHGATLLHLAAASIENGLDNGAPLRVDPSGYDPEITGKGACFVSLHRNDDLRGCVGSTVAHRALVVDTVENAYGAAFRDPRFPKLAPDELDGLDLSISLLSPPMPLTFASEDDLVRQLRVGIDGLIIADQGRRAVFLPVVWEGFGEPRAFLGRLRQKAGLRPDHWSATFKAWRFVAEELSAAALGEGARVWSRGPAH